MTELSWGTFCDEQIMRLVSTKLWLEECSGFLLVRAAFLHQEHFNDSHHMFLSNVCFVDLSDDSWPSSLLPLPDSAILFVVKSYVMSYRYPLTALVFKQTFVVVDLLLNSFFSPLFPAACLFRYNALSFIYLIYLLLIPLFAEPTSTSMQGKICSLTLFETSHTWWHRRHPSIAWRESWLPTTTKKKPPLWIAILFSVIQTSPSAGDLNFLEMRMDLAHSCVHEK